MPQHAFWLMLFALSVLAIAYRFYSAFLAARVAALDDARATPAHTLNDGQNYLPTNRWVLFGHHFAAISGAGPLVGPVLAAQFGYLPGFLWLVFGVVLGGAVQDFLVLAASVRHRGRSLAEIAREETGRVAGGTAMVAILFIVIVALAGLGLVVKKALGGEEVALPAARVVIPPGAFMSTRAEGPHVVATFPKGTEVDYGGGTGRERTRFSEGLTVRLPEGADLKLPEAETPGGPRSCALPAGCALLVRGSSWGVFTIACTIPIALFVGLYMYRIRKGRVLEASLIGGVLVLAATWAGSLIPGSRLEPVFSLSGNGVTAAMAAYGFVASVLPVWLLLCPRDYLSSFLKLGTIGVLVVGVLVANPRIEMPPVTVFATTGDGPIFPGKLFPFVFIVIMCGAISGFHALVSSGTTPKMLDREAHARSIGYGCMLLEGLVGVVALIAASTLPPHDYFAINTDLTKALKPEVQAKIASAVGEGHDNLPALEAQVQEQLRGRAGGAVSLAVGIARILAPPSAGWLVKYWYHFAIMFEALFILTTIDTGTRIARFLLQEVLGRASPALGRPSSIPGAVISSAAIVLAWSYFIWTGNVDTIWPMFGIANQLLAVVALATVTSWLVNEGRGRYAWTTLLPLAFVTTTTMTAGVELCQRFNGWRVSPPKPSMALIGTINLALTVIMLGCVIVILGASVKRWLGGPRPRPEAEPAPSLGMSGGRKPTHGA